MTIRFGLLATMALVGQGALSQPLVAAPSASLRTMHGWPTVLPCEAGPAVGPRESVHPTADSVLSALHGSGQRFPDFVAAAKARREGWVKLADSAQVADALVTRAKAAVQGGTWRILVVAIDACGDSMNTVPFVARVAAMAGVDLRIVLPTAGRAVQDSHRSLDGRMATPTFILLDETGAERGCIVEQPRALREWAAPQRSVVSLDSVHAGIRAFYAKDKGESIAQETVEMLEAAKAGRTHCDRGTAR